MNEEITQKKGKLLAGIVVGVGMKDTAKVAVTRYVEHPKYKKFIKKVKQYLVHDPGNTAAVGDKVHISECKPISKRKTFRMMPASSTTKSAEDAVADS